MKPEDVVPLFELHEKPLLRFAFFMTKDHEMAKDFVQDTFIKLINQPEMPESVSAWLYRVCRNLIIDHMRRGKKVIYHEDYFELSKGVEMEDAIAQNENLKVLQKAISGLSDVEKEIVVLKFYESKSYKEISLITGKSVSNVGFILHQAIKKLKELMLISDKNVPEIQV